MIDANADLELERLMSTAPRLKIMDPANAHLSCEIGIGGWSTIRKIADLASCTLVERRVGFITKAFKVSGDAATLNAFVQLMWNDELLGLDFRTQMRALAS